LNGHGLVRAILIIVSSRNLWGRIGKGSRPKRGVVIELDVRSMAVHETDVIWFTWKVCAVYRKG
jgi:hypothetical protein